MKNSIKGLFGVPEIKQYETYLGLPAVVGKNKNAILNYIKAECEEDFRGGRKNFYLKQGKGGSFKSGGSSHSSFYDGVF